MNLLLYFASFGSVFALFASVVAATLWVLAKFLQAWGRYIRSLLFPDDISKRRQTASTGLHPLHLKRAGQ